MICGYIVCVPSKFSLDINDYSDIDQRLEPFLNDWNVRQNYKGKTVNIPPDWDSDIFPVKYFEVIKKSGDPNYNPNEEENEIGLTLWAGWKEADNSGCYDHEVEINLFIMGKDVLKNDNYRVAAEILKAGGAEMQVFFKNKLITDFTKSEYRRVWWNVETVKSSVDKVWVDDMNEYS